MRQIARNFVLGLTILLPVILSIQLIVWLVATAEQYLRPVWLWILPDYLYFPGLAVLSFVALVTAVGITSRLPFASRLWSLPGAVLQRLPVFAFVYNTIKDFVDLLGGKNFSDQTVVSVEIPGVGGRLLGIVTKRGSETDSKLSRLMDDEEVAVYLPMSYQAGGYMLLLPASQVTEVDMQPGEALSLILSAGLGQQRGPMKDLME